MPEKPFEEITIKIGLRGRKNFPVLVERETNYELYELEDKAKGKALVIEKCHNEEMGLLSYVLHVIKDRDELQLRFPDLMQQAEEDFMGIIGSAITECKNCEKEVSDNHVP